MGTRPQRPGAFGNMAAVLGNLTATFKGADMGARTDLGVGAVVGARAACGFVVEAASGLVIGAGAAGGFILKAGAVGHILVGAGATVGIVSRPV